MRIVGEYLARAAVYEAMAATEADPSNKRTYADLASRYTHLARERRWKLATEALAASLPRDMPVAAE
jgi:hypothetical protein